MEGSSTESSASFINLYWAPKVMRAGSFLFLRCSGGRNGKGKSKPAASPTGPGQAPPKATAPANMCTEELAQRNWVDIRRVGEYCRHTLAGAAGGSPIFQVTH